MRGQGHTHAGSIASLVPPRQHQARLVSAASLLAPSLPLAAHTLALAEPLYRSVLPPFQARSCVGIGHGQTLNPVREAAQASGHKTAQATRPGSRPQRWPRQNHEGPEGLPLAKLSARRGSGNTMIV